MSKIREISVFVDESGSFAPEAADPASRYYIICFVLHDQDVDISSEVAKLEDALQNLGYPRNHCVHAGPLIRREQSYVNVSREERRALMRRMFIFFSKVPITYRCFKIDKHFSTDANAIHDALLQDMLSFLITHQKEFNSYDKLKIYYDQGQEQVTRLLKEAFAIYSSKVEWASDVKPENYRLFQAADLACTLELVRLKLEREGGISSSEYGFFGGISHLEKLYLKPLLRKEWR